MGTISLKNVRKAFGEAVIIPGADLEIKDGEFIVFVGPSGCGKSTLLRLIAGECRPTKGRLTVEGRDVGALRRDELPAHRARIGNVFQDAKLLPRRTIAENVAFPLEIDGGEPAEIDAAVAQALAAVGIADLASRYPHQVSGGERSRTAFARAIVNRPALVLADEPTGDLDPMTAYEIADLMSGLNRMGTTLVIATHAIDIVTALDRRVVSIEAGRVVRDGRLPR